jgi:hypothetical protein
MGAARSVSESRATLAVSAACASKSACRPAQALVGRLARLEVPSFRLLDRHSFQASAEHVGPRGHVEHQLPDGVGSGDGTRRGGFGRHAVEQPVKRWPVPVFAFDQRLELSGQQHGFRATRGWDALRHHFEVRDVGVERFEEALVLRVVAGPLRVVAGEATNAVHRVPKRQNAEARLVAFPASKHVDAAVAARGRQVLQPRAADVVRVRVRLLGLREAVPASRDHGLTSVNPPVTI